MLAELEFYFLDNMRLPGLWGEHCRVSLPPATPGDATGDSYKSSLCPNSYNSFISK